jgi:hypothetical protein
VLAASRQLDQETMWLPGVMAISLIVTEYLAGLGLIWNLFASAQDPVALTMLFLVATSAPAIVFTGLTKRPDSALPARVGLFASALVFALLMVGTWGGWLGKVRAEHWYSLGLSLAAFAVLAVLCLIGSGTDRRHWRWLGVAAAGAAFSISAYAIILNLHQKSALFVCVVSVAAVVAHANAMAWCPLKQSQRLLLWGTIGAGIATGGFVDLASITAPWQEEMLGRLAGAHGSTVSRLLADIEGEAPALVARANQPEWIDSATGFRRRSVSPPSLDFDCEMLSCELPAGASIDYPLPPRLGLEHHLYLEEGALELMIEGTAHRLSAGDCLRYKLMGESRFHAVGRRPARYILVLR